MTVAHFKLDMTLWRIGEKNVNMLNYIQYLFQMSSCRSLNPHLDQLIAETWFVHAAQSVAYSQLGGNQLTSNIQSNLTLLSYFADNVTPPL